MQERKKYKKSAWAKPTHIMYDLLAGHSSFKPNSTHIQGYIKTVLFTLFAILGALVLGLGMCFCMVWENIVLGTIIGLVGIVMLLSLIPIVKGIK